MIRMNNSRVMILFGQRFQKNGTLKEILSVSKKIFDEENRFRYINKSNWDDNYVNLSYSNLSLIDEDDLPF